MSVKSFPARGVSAVDKSFLANRFKTKLIGAAASVAMLVLLAACSTNANITGVGCSGNTGSFSNASLPANSQWTFELSGWQGNTSASSGISPYREAGVFTADGKGNLTAAADDFYQQGLGGTTGLFSNTGLTGSYNITANGTGTLTLKFPNTSTTENWAITMQGNSFYIIETDNFASAHGVAHMQTSPFAAPTGTFAFRVHALGSVSGFSAAVGTMSVTSGTINSGTVDLLNGGVLSTVAVSGAFAAPDTTGRGTATIAYGGSSFTFVYYVIDANTVQLFENDSNLGLGRMEAQIGAGSLTNASLMGPYAFGSFGDTANSYDGTKTVGQITADGAGGLSSGSYDGAQDGTVSSIASVTGSYNMSANGRFTLQINGAGASAVSIVGYLVNTGRAFFLINDPTKVEDGTMDQQSGSAFTTSSLTGQYAMVMGGYDPTDVVDRSGVVSSDGNGNLNTSYVLNRTGVVSAPGCISGTYTVAANGRVLANVSSLSSNLIFYVVNANEVYVLQGDGGTEIFGGLALQQGSVTDPPGGF